MKFASIKTAALLLTAITPVVAGDSISEAEVLAAQQGWCKA